MFRVAARADPAVAMLKESPNPPQASPTPSCTVSTVRLFSVRMAPQKEKGDDDDDDKIRSLWAFSCLTL